MTRNYVLKTPTGTVVMNETAYPTEDLFQHMLAGTSQVLAGDEINPAAPRRWPSTGWARGAVSAT